MPRTTLVCALLAGALAAAAVAFERVGLGLALVLLLVLVAGAGAARRPVSPLLLTLACALAVQPVLRDAGWVVALAAVAALVAGAAAVARPRTWPAVASAATMLLAVVPGTALVLGAARPLLPGASGPHATAVARGLALAVVLTAAFGALFASADSAFAQLAGDALQLDADPGTVAWRAVVGTAAVALAGALALAGRPPVEGPATAPRALGRTELRIALTALVTLFGAFVAVQLRVLFGGAGYVAETTGLGYGDYARQGFAQLVVVAALTLAVVAVARHRRDTVVRVLLGLLCALTLVVLASAHHRLGLVEDAYGFTRVRLGGHAVVVWLAAVFVLVLAAGASRRVARVAPRFALAGTLAGVLAFSLANPDAWIARRAVDRFEVRGTLDQDYLRGLSADALPELERLRPGVHDEVVPALRARLERPDGWAGLNVSRRRAR